MLPTPNLCFEVSSIVEQSCYDYYFHPIKCEKCGRVFRTYGGPECGFKCNKCGHIEKQSFVT